MFPVVILIHFRPLWYVSCGTYADILYCTPLHTIRMTNTYGYWHMQSLSRLPSAPVLTLYLLCALTYSLYVLAGYAPRFWVLFAGVTLLLFLTIFGTHSCTGICSSLLTTDTIVAILLLTPLLLSYWLYVRISLPASIICYWLFAYA